MTPTRLVCVVCILLLAVPAWGQERSWLAEGDAQGLWLTRVDKADGTFDLLTRPVGGRWNWVSTELAGVPVAVAAIGGNLHVVFQSGQYRIYSPGGGEGTPGDGLETAPLSVCGGTLADSSTPTVVAILPPPKVSTTAATTSPSPPPKSKTSGKGKGESVTGESTVTMEVRQNVRLRWQHLADLPVPASATGAGIRAAIFDGVPHVLLSDPAPKLLAWRDSAWQELPLNPPAAPLTILGLVAVEDRLTMVATVEGEGGGLVLTVGTYTARDKGFSWQPVTENGKSFAWPANRVAMLARLGQRVAMVWRQGHELFLATFSPITGQLEPTEAIPTDDQSSLDQVGEEIYNYFLLGVFVLVVLSLLRTRGPVPYKPFLLPPHMEPANLGKRLLAAVIDLLPCNLVAGVWVQLFIPSYATRDMNDLLLRVVSDKMAPPFHIVLAGILVMLVYVPYCVLMEKRFGATLGKMIMKLRVVGDEGRSLGLREAMLRNLVKVMEFSWVPLLPLLLLVPLLSRHRQRLGDMLARTVVIDARCEQRPPPLPGQDGGSASDDDHQPDSPLPPPPP